MPSASAIAACFNALRGWLAPFSAVSPRCADRDAAGVGHLGGPFVLGNVQGVQAVIQAPAEAGGGQVGPSLFDGFVCAVGSQVHNSPVDCLVDPGRVLFEVSRFIRLTPCQGLIGSRSAAWF